MLIIDIALVFYLIAFSFLFQLFSWDYSSVLALVLYVSIIFYFFKSKPISLAFFSYIIILGGTSFIAGVGIEAGGSLIETDFVGQASSAFLRLVVFYAIFFLFFSMTFSEHKTSLFFLSRSSVRLHSFPSLMWVCVIFSSFVVISGILAGFIEGFALLEGVNRYEIRSESSSTSALFFNFYLNNRVFVALSMAAISLSGHKVIALISIILMLVLVFISILHGEQFMATLQIALTIMIPISIIKYKGSSFLNFKTFLLFCGSVFIGFISIYFAYSAQGFDFSNMYLARSLLQGQLWYVVDSQSSFLNAPLEGGGQAFYRVLSSLIIFEAPGFSSIKISGLIDFMKSYSVPDIFYTMSDRNVTFTMGQMAIPVYWFGFLGGAIFVAFTGLFVGLMFNLIVTSVLYGGPIILFISAKVLMNVNFALQQGEYWFLFGIREFLFILVLMLTIALSNKFKISL